MEQECITKRFTNLNLRIFLIENINNKEIIINKLEKDNTYFGRILIY
jgi:hypothetical protein